jgi:hypothetical protein
LATTAIDRLRSMLNSVDEGFRLETDVVVKMLSTVYSIFVRQGEPIRDRDLLDGNTVRKMAAWLESHWDLIEGGLVGVGRQMVELDLKFNVHYRSMNALILIASWRLTYDFWAEQNGVPSQTRDILLQNGDRMLRRSAEYWMVLNQWAGTWSSGTDEATVDYSKRIADSAKQSSDTTHAQFHASACLRLAEWLIALGGKAKEFIESLQAEDRNTVGMYRVPLAIWQREEPKRSAAATCVLIGASTRKAPSIEVDHILPWGVWDGATKEGDSGELRTLGNSIGNCTLLSKTFNVTKSKKSLDTWLSELKTMDGFDPDAWKQALQIPAELAAVDQENARESIQEVCELIKKREWEIKSGLYTYIEKCKERVLTSGEDQTP